ncbi:MAG TPA: hypothetical protein VJ959_15470 [Desulfotignum sp.]|nr:hypothetical protein [Desulfotignum sp.]
MKHLIIGNGIAGINLLTKGLDDLVGLVGTRFAVEPDPEKAAVFLIQVIEKKTQSTGAAQPGPSITMEGQ